MSKILFLGLNTLDIQYRVRKFPKTNSKTQAIDNQVHAGGPATNAAVTCAFLGSETDLLTPIGDHAFSDFLKKDIEKSGVSIVDPIKNQQGYPVLSSIVTSEENGERTVFYYRPEKNEKIISEEYPDISMYKMVMFDGFYPQLAIPIAQECRENGIITVLDGGSWKDETRDLFAFIDIAICSDDFNVPGCDNPDYTFNYLHDQGVQYAAITRGKDNTLYSSENILGEIPVDPINAVDTLGAGDVLHGAFCHYFRLGNDFIQSLLLASKIASASCRFFGVREWMKNDLPK